MGDEPAQPVEVLLVENDPGDAMMIRESFGQARKDVRFHLVTGCRRALQFVRHAAGYEDAEVKRVYALQADACIAKPADYDGFRRLAQEILTARSCSGDRRARRALEWHEAGRQRVIELGPPGVSAGLSGRRVAESLAVGRLEALLNAI